jgi:hypothetical protein
MKPNLIKWKDIKRAAVVLGIITGKPWRDQFAITGNNARTLVGKNRQGEATKTRHLRNHPLIKTQRPCQS